MTWTDDMQAVLVKRASEGKSFQDVADELGCTRNCVAGRANRTGITFHGTNTVWTTEDLIKLRKLAAAGFSMAEAAEKLRSTKGAVHGAARNYGITFRCSAARHRQRSSAGQKRSWDKDDGARRRANAERARKYFADWWARGRA